MARNAYKYQATWVLVLSAVLLTSLFSFSYLKSTSLTGLGISITADEPSLYEDSVGKEGSHRLRHGSAVNHSNPGTTQVLEAWNDSTALHQSPTELRQESSQTGIDAVPVSKRALGFLTWRRLNRQGKLLSCLMQGDDTTAQSRWTQYAQLRQWGWTLDQEEGRDYTYVDGEWQGVNIGDLTGGIQMRWTHTLDTDHPQSNGNGATEAITYPHTNAEYVNIFFPALGVIFANRNYGAQYMIEEGLASVHPWRGEDGTALPVTQLKQWSDVLFLTWQHLTTDQERKNVRWVARRIITNGMTKEVIGKACKTKGVAVSKPKSDPLDRDGPAWRAPTWPGVVFLSGETGFNALLATPNAKGVVWFLVQHREALGHRTIKSIRAWHDQARGFGYTPSMLFEIGFS